MVTPPNSIFAQIIFSSARNLVTAVLHFFSLTEILLTEELHASPEDDKNAPHLVLKIKSTG